MTRFNFCLVCWLQLAHLLAADNSDFANINALSSTGSPSGVAYGVAVDSISTTLYVLGQINSTAGYLLKLYPNGTRIWSIEIVTVLNERQCQIAVDPVTQHAFVHGFSPGDMGIELAPNIPASVQLRAGVWANELGLFVAVGAGTNKVVTSSDGMTWSAQTTPAGIGDLVDITWASQIPMFVAVGGSSVITSPNGITWTSRTATIGLLRSIAWSSTLPLFVAVGLNTQFMKSTDGITWSTLTPSIPATLNRVFAITWYPSSFVIVGEEDSDSDMGYAMYKILSSTNGNSFTVTYASSEYVSNINAREITWVPDKNLLVTVGYVNNFGQRGRIVTSSDWSINRFSSVQVNAGYPYYQLYSVAYSPDFGKFIAIGYKLAYDGVTTQTFFGVFTSSDGALWTEEINNFPLPPGCTYSDLTSGRIFWSPGWSKFVVVGDKIATIGKANEGFVSRFQPNTGALNWTKTFGSGIQAANSLKAGGLYVYAGGTTKTGFNGATGGGALDSYLIKLLTSNGSTAWTRVWGTSSDENMNGIDFDQSSGVIYAVGSTAGTFSGQTNSGGLDVFISRIDMPSGTVLGTQQFGGAQSDIGYAILVDSVRAVLYVGGIAGGAIGGIPLMSTASDQILARFDLQTGDAATMRWVKFLGGTGSSDTAFALNLDPLTGNIYVAGSVSAALSSVTGVQTTFYGGTSDMTVALYTNAGILQWARIAGTSNTDAAYGISYIPDGRFCFVGRWSSSSGAAIIYSIPVSTSTIISTVTQTNWQSLSFTQTNTAYSSVSATIVSSQTQQVTQTATQINSATLSVPSSITVVSSATQTNWQSLSFTQTNTAIISEVLTSIQTVQNTESFTKINSATISITVPTLVVLTSLATEHSLQSVFITQTNVATSLDFIGTTTQATITVSVMVTNVETSILATQVTTVLTCSTSDIPEGKTTQQNSSTAVSTEAVLIWAILSGVLGLCIGIIVSFSALRLSRKAGKRLPTGRTSKADPELSLPKSNFITFPQNVALAKFPAYLEESASSQMFSMFAASDQSTNPAPIFSQLVRSDAVGPSPLVISGQSIAPQDQLQAILHTGNA